MKVQDVLTNNGTRYLLLDDDMKVVDEVHRYLKFLDYCGKSPNTLKNYAYHLKTYYDYCARKGTNPLSVFANQNRRPVDFLCEFMLWLQYPDCAEGIIHFDREHPKRSNRTINVIMAAVLSFYQYLSSNEELNELTINRIERRQYMYKSMLFEMMHHDITVEKSILRKPEPPRNVNAITREQYKMLLPLCPQRRDRILIALLFEGGLRISEALGLHISDLDELEDGIVKIVPRENNENGARVKNYAGGMIKLPNYVIDLIIEYLSEDVAEYDSDFLFLTLNGQSKGSPLKIGAVERLFERLSLKIGFKVHPHMLRHGFATEKLEAGWQMIDIQMYLRHKSITSTQIYASYSDQLKKNIMRKFLDENEDQMRVIADAIRHAEQ